MLPFIRHWQTPLLSLLLALLLFQAVGWLAAWDFARRESRRDAGSLLQQPSTPTQWHVFAAGALQLLLVDKREIRLDGRLYDIRTVLTRGDSVLVELYHDTREEALFDALLALYNPSVSSSGPRPHAFLVSLLKWAGDEYLLPAGPAGFAEGPDCTLQVFSFLLPGSRVPPAAPGPPPRMAHMEHGARASARFESVNTLDDALICV